MKEETMIVSLSILSLIQTQNNNEVRIEYAFLNIKKHRTLDIPIFKTLFSLKFIVRIKLFTTISYNRQLRVNMR